MITATAKPRVRGIFVSTICRNNCDHCGGRNSDGTFRYREMLMQRPVIDEMKRKATLDDDLGICGGNPLLWREGNLLLGDLLAELRDEAGVRSFRMTVFPLDEKDKESGLSLYSLSKVAGNVRLWLSVNVFGRNEKDEYVDGELDMRIALTVQLAHDVGITRVFPVVRYMPSVEKETLSHLPGKIRGSYEDLRPREKLNHLACGIGKGIGVWKFEMANRMGGEDIAVVDELDSECVWDGKTLAIMPDGGIVPGCEQVGCIGVRPFASIFDEWGTIIRQAGEEHERSRQLTGKIYYSSCEKHHEMGKET